MKSVYTLGALLLSLIVMNAHAEWSKSYTIEYSLGEGDSRASTRQAAVEEIRMKASREAGTYVEGTTTLHASGQVTEQVRVLSASMIKITDVRDKLSINKAGQAMLQVSAKVNLDDKELSRRIEALRQDQDKDLKLKQLSAENDELFKALKQIRLEMASKSDSVVIGQLLARQESTIRKLSDNNRLAGQIFEEGALARMMIDNEKKVLESEQEFDREFYEYMANSRMSAEIKTIELVGESPEVYARVWINVRLKLDREYLTRLFERYVNVQNHNEFISIPEDRKSVENGGSISKSRMRRYLKRKFVNAFVRMGNKRLVVPILWDCHMEVDINKTLPLELTRAELEQANSLEVTVVHSMAPENKKPI